MEDAEEDLKDRLKSVLRVKGDAYSNGKEIEDNVCFFKIHFHIFC